MQRTLWQQRGALGTNQLGQAVTGPPGISTQDQSLADKTHECAARLVEYENSSR